MKFAVFTHVPHHFKEGRYYAYGPYVKEMNLWFKHVDEVLVVAPKCEMALSKIDLPYCHENIKFDATPAFSFISVKAVLLAFFALPQVFWKTFSAMLQADHIHLRCPGNIGLLACLVQIFFPKKPKTAKYAGNWDPNAKQPLSYRIQKWLLSNTFLTKNMKVLVYGQWEGSSGNIVPFFTASYHECDKKQMAERTLNKTLRFLFVGTLSKGKRPRYAVELIEKLRRNGYDVRLDVFGEGVERAYLEDYIVINNLSGCVALHGNQPSDVIEKNYQQSHFLLLPSQSEGWPKVVAEAMFWGCVPLATPVSCVPYMLGNGSRGLLLDMVMDDDMARLIALMEESDRYMRMASDGLQWSRRFTMDAFEEAIAGFLKG